MDITVDMPFGKNTIPVSIPEENHFKTYAIAEPPSVDDARREITHLLKHPTKGLPLSSLIDAQDRVCILISDITRPVPSQLLVSALLQTMDIPDENVVCVVATGLHRDNTDEEIRNMLGNEIVNRIPVYNHQAFTPSRLTSVGKTSGGTPVSINSMVEAADKIITTGYIEPHEFAGFTGGRKSILPGVSGVDTINYNHRIENMDHPLARIGILENNPIHEDMVEAASLVGVDFMINVVLNRDNHIARVVSGDLVSAHEEGVSFYRSFAQIPVDNPADIVVASTGYPLDINFYQSVKGAMAAEPFVREDGEIILLANCEDGFGTDLFRHWMISCSTAEDIQTKMKKEPYRADIDHCYLLARVLNKAHITVVTEEPSVHVMKKSLLSVTASVEEALSAAFSRLGTGSQIAFLPFATRFVPESH
jgi:nickel-dependent lactate racemase